LNILFLPFASFVEGDEATAKLSRQIPRRLGAELEKALKDHKVTTKFLSLRGTRADGAPGFAASSELPSTSDIITTGELYGATVALIGKLGFTEHNILFEARVIDIPKKSEVFAKRYETYPSYFFDAAEEVKLRITQALGIELSEEERIQLFRRITESWQAYLYFLLAEDDKYGLETGILPIEPYAALGYYKEALEIDPGFDAARLSMQHYIILLLQNEELLAMGKFPNEFSKYVEFLPQDFVTEIQNFL